MNGLEHELNVRKSQKMDAYSSQIGWIQETGTDLADNSLNILRFQMTKKTEPTLDLLNDAFAELADNLDSGVAFLPRHATLRMAEAGAKAANISTEQALRVYAAMVAADSFDEDWGTHVPKGQSIN